MSSTRNGYLDVRGPTSVVKYFFESYLLVLKAKSQIYEMSF